MAYQWSFIGAGNMAASIVGGLVASGTDAGSIALHDVDADAASRLADQHGAMAVAELADVLPSRGVVIAVKPDTVETVCRRLADAFATGSSDGNSVQSRPMILSIAAGVRAIDIARWLPADTAIVRCMPNTPALLGLGASALFANTHCSDVQREQALQMLGSVGEVVEVHDEAELDAVTALSGSGPAYFFYLIEQMAAGGVNLGLDEEVARRLAIQTACGAAAMARQGDDTPGELRTKVTSKGGTTAAAIESFQTQGFPAMVERAMQASRARAIDMGDEYSAD